MKEFWVSSGHHLTLRTAGGGLAVTDELLLAYLARPEVLPPQDACAAERALHSALMAEPRRAVAPSEIAALADPDARENWTYLLAFRDRLIAHETIEAAYCDMARNGASDVPPLFLAQLTHLVLRNALDGIEDTRVLRAGELFFRAQRASTHEGRLLLADAEIIEALEAEPHASPLLAMMGQDKLRELDVLTDDNAFDYWSRSDAFATVLDFSARASREAFCRVIEYWLRHLMGIKATASPLDAITDQDWRWFIGLDAEGTRIGNALWRNDWMPDEMKARAIAFFRLDLGPDVPVREAVRGKPVYLILGMTSERVVRMKAQNLIAGLPLLERV
jgi:hypothetical protein